MSFILVCRGNQTTKTGISTWRIMIKPVMALKLKLLLCRCIIVQRKEIRCPRLYSCQNESAQGRLFFKMWLLNSNKLELVSKELNHLAAILDVYAGSLIFMVKKNIIIFLKEKGNTFTLLIIFIVKSLQKEQNSTNLLLPE